MYFGCEFFRETFHLCERIHHSNCYHIIQLFSFMHCHPKPHPPRDTSDPISCQRSERAYAELSVVRSVSGLSEETRPPPSLLNTRTRMVGCGLVHCVIRRRPNMVSVEFA